MGFFKKIFKPVSRVLDKIIPNEIKPALPFAAAFAPYLLPTGIMGAGVAQRALMGGGLNILGQLSQEGNEGDINLLSAGLGALTGAMTAPGTAPTTARGDLITTSPDFSSALNPADAAELTTRLPGFGAERVVSAGTPGFRDYMARGIERFGAESAGGQIFTGLDKASKFMQAPGLTKFTAPIAQGTGDLMFAQAKRDQDEYDRMMQEESEADAASDAQSAFAIRRAMEAQGATEEEIEDAIYAAGYKKGGRVKYNIGGITQAVGKLENEAQNFARQISIDPDVTMDDIVEEFEIVFKRKPKDMDELKEFYENKYEYKGPGDVKMEEKIKEKMIVGAKDGGLMNLGGKEMDLRKGGFVPIGKKEKADDVPARLSKNEFVMTADAVRAAGGGSVNEGAKRMYKVMNDLEARA